MNVTIGLSDCLPVLVLAQQQRCPPNFDVLGTLTELAAGSSWDEEEEGREGLQGYENDDNGVIIYGDRNAQNGM
jgi:hypothetical protein